MLQLDASIDKHGSRRSLNHETLAGQKSLKNCGHMIGNVCDPSANNICSNNCAIHTHGHDCYRPVTQVMAEHPGEDGYCYFNYTGFWVTPVGDDPDFEQYAINGILGLRGTGFYQGLHTGPIGPMWTFKFDGKVITSQIDLSHYSYDDLYGYSLGYLQGQGFDASMVKNSTNWISMVGERCEEIQRTYNFKDEELVLADWLDDNMVLLTKVLCSAGIEPYAIIGPAVREKAKWKSVDDCEAITPRDFAKHHYVKCVLGYPNAASDAAYLNLRACLNGNHIGHFTDCPYSPNISF
eukprot:Skav234746  [mRNA]  locus=scaffold14:568580:569791:- [translate_table: standard]